MPGKEYETIQTLKSELRALYQRVQELDEKLRDFTPQPSPPEALSEPVLITAAYLLTCLYSCIEDQLLAIARVFENRVENPAARRREVLERMQLEIEGVRPRVLGRTAFRLLNELRGFRRMFRSAYAYGLDAERVGLVLRQWEKDKTAVYADLRNFIDTVAAMTTGEV